MKSLMKRMKSGKEFFAFSSVSRFMAVAVLMIAMLMPVESFAQSARIKRGEKNVQVDNRHYNKNNGNKYAVKNADKPRGYKKDNDRLFSNKGGGKHVPDRFIKPAAVHHNHHLQPIYKPAPVVVHAPVAAPPPPPRPVVVNHCNGEAASAAAVAIGIVGLISLLAD